jgi:hypothetical protein
MVLRLSEAGDPFEASDRKQIGSCVTKRWVYYRTRHATRVWQGNWFSVAIRPVSKATQ